MKWKIAVLILLAVVVMGCSGTHEVVHTKIPVNNLVFLNGSVGIMYHKDGRVFLAIINCTNTTPFMHVKTPAIMVFNGSYLESITINGTKYSVSSLFVRKVNGSQILWKRLR